METKVTFARRLDTRFDLAVARLDGWHHGGADHDVVEIDQARIRVTMRLPRGRFKRSLPMELEMERWSDSAGTWVTLAPRRRFRPTDRYYDDGHALIDELAAALEGSGQLAA